MRHWHPYIADVMRIPVPDSPVPGYPVPGRMREAKFRQAAFVYLHVAILYEAAALINGAFFAGADERVVPAFYLTAIVVVMINLWMLARAGWDL